MSKAKINIVGGDGAFFEQFVKAISLGQSVDGAVNSSEQLQHLLREYLKGDRSLPEDLKAILSKPGAGGDLTGLAALALAARLPSNGEKA